MNSLLGGKNVQSKVMANTYPDAPLLFKDKVFLEMLGLPLEYKMPQGQVLFKTYKILWQLLYSL